MNESLSQIYVVDDDVSVREGVGRLIRSAGLKVKTFATAQEILASLQTKLPSCLVLDVQLPDIDGLELRVIEIYEESGHACGVDYNHNKWCLTVEGFEGSTTVTMPNGEIVRK